MMVCKDACRNHYPTKGHKQHHWAQQGYVKCITCSFTVKTTDLRCKCCNYKFRKSPRETNSIRYYHTVTRPRVLLEQKILIVEEEQKPRKRNFKRRTLKTAPCCWCGIETECINKTKTLKCWNCRMKMIKDYQHQHNSLLVNTNYAEQK